LNHGVTEANARVRFELESRPENVALVRTGLAALDDIFSFGEILLTDLKTAVSEACNNVVVHAYPDTLGPMLVSIELAPDVIEVAVRDYGEGIRQLAASEDRMGLGLGVMSALADRVEFRHPRGGGTEVKMCFRRSEDAAFGFFLDSDEEMLPLELSGDAVIWFQPVSLMRPVLGRIFRAIAASSQFTFERFADLYAVTDALAAYAEYASAAETIGIAITGAPRRLELVGGPFAGGSGPLRDPFQEGASDELTSRREALSELVDALTVNDLGDKATLQLVLVDSTRAN
jgi:serine/threonine-protein kinase RsbW